MNFFFYLLYVAFVYLRPFETFFEDFQVYRPMVVLAGVAILGAVVTSVLRGRINIRLSHLACLAALLACIALSKITNGWTGGAAVALADFSTSALLFLLTAGSITSISRLRTTMSLLLVITLILTLAGVAAYHFGFMSDRLVLRQYNGTGDEPPTAEEITRPADDTFGRYLWRVRSLGFLNDPNDFAQVLVMVLPFLGLWYRRGRKTRNLVLVGLSGAVIFYAIYLTHSRGAFIGVASFMFFSLRARLGMMRTGILIGLLLVGLVISNAAGGRGFSTDEESAGSRILAWSDGLMMLRTKPLFGVGYGAFTDHHERTAHNSFVLCFSELGLIGYFIWLAMIVSALLDVNVVAEAPAGTLQPELLSAAGMLRASLVGFLSCAWFLSRTYAPPLFILLALCGAAWGCANEHAPDKGSIRPPRWVPRTASALIGSIAVVYIMVMIKHAG